MRKKVNCSGFFKNERAPMGGGNPPRSCCCCCFAFTFFVFDSPPLPLSGGRKEREIERESKRGKKNPLFFFNSFCCFCCRSGYRAPSLSLSLTLSLCLSLSLSLSLCVWMFVHSLVILSSLSVSTSLSSYSGIGRPRRSVSRFSFFFETFFLAAAFLEPAPSAAEDFCARYQRAMFPIIRMPTSPRQTVTTVRAVVSGSSSKEDFF